MSPRANRGARLPALCALAWLGLALAAARGASRGAPALEEDAPGFSVSWSGGGQGVSLPVPAAAFFLEAGESPHPELPAAGLSAAFAARLRAPGSGRMRFGFELEGGSARLSLNRPGGEGLALCDSEGGTSLTDWVELRSGELLELVLSFRREGSGPARLRALWELERDGRQGFALEPIPPRAVHRWPSLGAAAESGRRALLGRVLLERKGCTHCHAPSQRGAQAVGLRARSPLDRLAAGASVAWLERWIAAPARLRPGSDMPALLPAGPQGREAARSLAHFLSSLEPQRAPSPLLRREEIRRGAELYHQRGCVACHGPFEPPPDRSEESEFLPFPLELPPPVPLGELGGRFTLDSASAFLLEPEICFPDRRMPSMGLAPEEARHIASYLCSRFLDPGGREAADPERVEQGRALLLGAGCLACHTLPGAEPPPPRAPGLEELDPERGCLSPEPGALPRFELGPDERELLRAGLASVRRASGAPALLDRTERALELHGCYHCHRIDGRGGLAPELSPWFGCDQEVDLGDEGRLPPELMEAGSKLRGDWLERVISEGARARPWQRARMPAFGPELGRELARGLAARAGLRPGADREPPATLEERVLAGRELAGMGAMACVSCHRHGEREGVGTPGLDLAAFGQRLRYEWFERFLPDPARLLPSTRMPSFGAGGRSAFHQLGGDQGAQVEALWAWCSLGPDGPAPPDPEGGAGTRVRVGERPVVLRCFLEGVGSRAVAVGFPLGVHIAFDAEGCRLAHSWQGEFLDAAPIWSGRGGQPVVSGGPILWRARPGPLLLAGERPERWPEQESGARFRGYRLDAGSVPSFLWSLGTLEIEERITPALAPLRLLRDIRLRGALEGGRLWVRLGPGEELLARSPVQVVETHRPEGSEERWLGLDFPPFAAGLGIQVEVRP